MSAEKQEVKTLADALPEEITRVRKIQDEFKSLRGRPGIIVEPQIMMMEHDIVNATRACASGDVLLMLQWHEKLKEYES
jgi:hypothetical protein